MSSVYPLEIATWICCPFLFFGQKEDYKIEQLQNPFKDEVQQSLNSNLLTSLGKFNLQMVDFIS